MKHLTKALAIGLALVATACSQGGDVDWPYYGNDAHEQRFSELDQVDRENVERLGLAWYHEFDSDRGQEATPIVVDGVLYTSTAWSVVYAFNAETGEPLWSFDPEVPRDTLASACCDAVNRGVAVQDGRVFVGALDGRLIAIDAGSGEQLWSVDTVDRSDPDRHYTITGAPRIAGDKVVIGNGGAEFGVRGYVTAYDTASGEQAWRFYLTPNPDGEADGAASDEVLRETAAETWHDGEWRESGGGGTAWDSMTYDPETNLLFIGSGNGSPFDYQRRSGGEGDNLFLSSIVAVNADTGEYVWHYQTTPGDAWDYTATQHMIAARLTIDGQERDVLMQAPKNGFFYVLDRRTGELISAVPFAPVTWATGIDAETGRPILAPGAHYRDAAAILQPGPFGAHSWQAMSYSPRTGLVYIPVQLMTGEYAPDPSFARRPIGQNAGIRMGEFPIDQVDAIRQATSGQLLAWDPVAQEARWSVPHQWFLNGGTLVTAGDLVFQGDADGRFAAYDAENGDQLWSYDAGNGIIAPPITYRVGGTQYIAVMVGFGGAGPIVGRLVPDHPRRRGRLLVFRLDGEATAPAFEDTALAPIDVAGVTSDGDPDAGMAQYNRTCAVCHGANASIPYTADLRRSAALASADAWRSIVIDGALRDSGMIGFSRVLTPRDAENIRAYVLRHARRAQANEES